MNFEHILRHNSRRTEVIGDLEWRESPGATYELHLDVDPQYQRQGIGRSMVEELERVAIEKEGMSLFSYSAQDNEKAYAFFLGVKFVPYFVRNFYGTGRNAFLWVKVIGSPK